MEKKIIETQKATFAAGCFWGVEEKFRTTKGVLETRAGYIGGKMKNPAYEDVCTNKTGHAEAVEIIYEPRKVSYEHLVTLFFSLHDPTQLDRQGPDIGTQYRSAIFYHSDEQKKAAEKIKKGLNASDKFQAPIVTVIIEATKFYPAEDYHQKYLMKRGANVCH